MSGGRPGRRERSPEPVPAGLSPADVERLIRGQQYTTPPRVREEEQPVSGPLAAVDMIRRAPVTVAQLPAVTAQAGLLGDRVLPVLARRYRNGTHKSLLWADDASARGMTTGAIAAALDLRPQTPERRALGEALSGLRKHGLLHYEYDRVLDAEVRWFLTAAGLEVGDRPAGPVTQDPLSSGGVTP